MTQPSNPTYGAYAFAILFAFLFAFIIVFAMFSESRERTARIEAFSTCVANNKPIDECKSLLDK